MSAQNVSAVVVAERLCSALDQVGSALVDLNLDALLVTEQTLAELVRSFQPPSHETGWPGGSEGGRQESQQQESVGRDRREIETVVQHGRSALLRCRRLGESFSAIARARMQVCSGSDEYGRGGYVNQPSVSTVKVTV